MKRLLSVALAVLAAAACSSTTLPVPGERSPRLEFTAAPDARDYLFPVPKATFQPVAGGVEVATMMTLPQGCQELDAVLEERGPLLVVTVSIVALRTFAVCDGGRAANYAYTARLRDIAPGAHHLTVRHVYPEGEHPDRVVLDTNVVID